MKLTTLTIAVALTASSAAQAQSETDWAPMAAVETSPDRSDGPSLRFGFNWGWSPLTRVNAPGQSRGDEGIVSFGLHLRAGVQFTRNFAAYYQASGFLGDTVKVCVKGPSLSFSGSGRGTYSPQGCTNYWIPVHASSVLVETTLAGSFQLALGPSILYGQFGDGPIGTDPVGGGAVARLGAVFAHGQTSSMRRSFSIGLQGQVGFFPGDGRFVDVAIYVGYELF